MIAFSFLRNSLNFVEMVHENGNPAIRQFAKRSSSPTFIHENLTDEQSQQSFKKLIREAVEQYRLDGQTVVSMDSRLAMVKKFLMDSGTEDEQVFDQLRWEYHQIFPDTVVNDYSLVFERISSGFFEDRDEILSVAIRKDILDSITSLFDDTSLSVSRVEIDLFSAHHGINQIYHIDPNELSALADIRRDAIKIQFVRESEVFDFHDITLTKDGENANSEAFESAESLSRLLNKELRRKLMEYRLGNEEKAINTLYLFGEKANSELADYLAASPARNVLLVEPFKKVEMTANLGEMSEAVALSSEYIISIGSALRLI